MKTINITKKLHSKIIKFIENNQPKVFWDYNDELSKEHIVQILESKDGIFDVENEIFDYNPDYISEIKHTFLKEHLLDEFKTELEDEFNNIFKDEEDYFIQNEIENYLFDEFLLNVQVDLNFNELLNITGNLDVLVKVYSNYDCCNSFDNPDEKSETYLSEVYKRVKTGVKKEDYKYEFYNGAYGGSLFCFAFSTDIKTLIELKNNFNKEIFIPKGTQFGFFSDFQGSGSMFEKTTYRNMTLPKYGNTKYDSIDIIADLEQDYNMQQVYGHTSDFLEDQDIRVS